MNSFSTWLTAIMLLIFATMVAMAFQFPAGARFMPFVVGFPGIALCMLQLCLDGMRVPGGRFSTYRFRSAPKAGRPAELAGDDLPEFGAHTVAAS